MKSPKVAIVHDYLVARGGAEKVVEAISEIFPQAPVYTGIYKSHAFTPTITSKQVITHGQPANFILNALPKHLTFLMPALFENFDLHEYDIVISSSSSYAKGVLTKPGQLHISYMHTPPRFLYKYSVESTQRDKWYYKPAVSYVDNYLRIWDYLAAQRPDFIVTNSENVRERIRKFYRRDARVIYPPIDKVDPKQEQKDNLSNPYYLAVGRLSQYKNFDLLINAFNLTGLSLVIVGNGKEFSRLKRLAKSNVKIMQGITDNHKHTLWENSLGFIFPVVDEDFGIVVIESLLHGKPVLAHKSGGPLEIIDEGVSGLFFEDVSLEGFISKLKEFDQMIGEKKFDSGHIKKSTERFTNRDFKKEFEKFVFEKWEQHARASGNNYN